MQTQLPDLEITLPARAENVAVVRHAVGGLGEVLEVDDQTLSDIKLAVTEACTNVVVHAYPDGEGPMGLRASIDERRLSLVVTDRGRGIVPRPDSPGLGLGLPLIATLAESLELGTGRSEETEVRMTFDLGAPVADDGALRMSDGQHRQRGRRPHPQRPARRRRARARGRDARRARPVPDRPPRRRHPAHRRRRRPRAGARSQRPRLRRGRRRRRAPGAARRPSCGPTGRSGCWPTATCPASGNVFDRVADDVQAGTMANGDGGELILRLNFRT